MESWRDVFSLYPDNPEPKDYAKAIRSAEIIISKDLAPFEIEWLAHTLLFKPVSLFETITSKRTCEDWMKALSDSFKILSKIVDKYWDVVKNYDTDIVELCMLPFDVTTRKEAIFCLLTVVKHSDVEISDLVVTRHIRALEEAKTCKAPLAQLVGAICMDHPERVQEHFSRIWRIYLTMLQPNNKTDQVVNSVLQGINGLFEHFGDDIAITELNRFYGMMSRECIKIPKCLEVLLSILKHHARLFKELLTADRALRLYLWQLDSKNAMDALSNIYDVVLSEENTEAIINTEIVPRMGSGSVLIRHTALRILMQAKTGSTNIPSVCSSVDLEFQLRTKKLSYEEANTVSWCIESSVSNTETMLLTAIMFYDNLPTSKKRDIVVNGILKASDDVRKAALILLLKLCLQEDLDRYMDVWRQLLDNTTGPDLAKTVFILQDAVHHILEVLASFCVGDQKAYTEIRPLLSVMAVLLSLQKTEFSTREWCQAFRPSIIHLARMYAVDPVRMLNEAEDNETINVERFDQDTVLSKLLSTLSTTQDTSNDDTLSAFQKIFSKEHTEPKVLSKALSKLDIILQTENVKVDKLHLSWIINQIMRLKTKTVSDDKDARIFHKDVAMILGKYGHLAHTENFTEDIYVLKLKNKIILNISNIVDPTIFKVDLQRVFQLCLLWGEKEALYSLLVILTANLCDRIDPGLQEATIRVIHVLLRSNARTSGTEIGVNPSLLVCNTVASVQRIMEFITVEPCPDVRRRLSECLEVLLNHDPGSETTGLLLDLVAEQAVFMISRDDSSSIIPGLDITRAFLSALVDNNTLAIQYLPTIIKHTTNLNQCTMEIFQKASNVFIEKIDLFTADQIRKLLINMIEKLAMHTVCTETSLYTVLRFTKRVLEIKNYDPEIIVDEILSMCKNLTIISPQFLNLVTILAFFTVEINLNNDLRKTIVDFENHLILRELLKIEFDVEIEKLNGVLVFLKEFSVELTEIDLAGTLQCIEHLIQNIPPVSILPLNQNLASCLSVYVTYPNYLPRMKTSYEKWSKKLDIENITEHIEERILFSEFPDNFSDTIHALKIMSGILEIPTLQAQNWTAMLLQNSSQADLKWGRLFLSDLLSVSEKVLTVDEFEQILDENLDFVKCYINVYFKRLIERPFVLKADKSCLIVQIVEYFAENYNQDDLENILEFVNYFWPSFEETSSFDEKLTVLLNLLRLPMRVGLVCPAVKWAISILTTETTSLEDKIKIIATLPAGEEYSTYYRTFASHLPVRLSEIQGAYIAPFRALLDSLVRNGDMTLLDIIITLAGGDDTKGWWDFAIDACMSSLAAKEDTDVLDKAYQKTKSAANLGVCNRILLPLLRHSSRKFCEQYMPTIVVELFNVLRVGFKEPTGSDLYRRRLVSYAVTFNILKVAFDKFNTTSLECGVINERAGSQKPWYFLEQTSKYCVTISSTFKCPADATAELKETYLWLQCASYNCFATAVCRRKLSKNLCARIFNVQAWGNIIDKDAEYTFDLKSYATNRGSRPVKRSGDAVATSSSLSGSVRSRLFLTTLSENPLQFDMIPADEELEEEEEDSGTDLEDSALNGYGCLTTISNLLREASRLDHTDWITSLTTAFTTDVVLNVKWLLSQAICNAGEDLTPHASVLCPALLQLIADTPATISETNVLNNLHIDIISTIIKWNVPDLTHNNNLNKTIEFFINTCMEYRDKIYVRRRLLNVFNGILQLYGKIVTINWSVFEYYYKGTPKLLTPILPIFERLLKNGVRLPNLLEAITAIQDPQQWLGASKLAEVCGLAFSLADSVARETFLAKFWHILNAVRGTSVGCYIKTLFYAQKWCYHCCNFQHFKIITDLSTKVERGKCLSIISKYLEETTKTNDMTQQEYFTDMFNIISLSELLDGDLRVEALKIARNSFKYMDNGSKSEILKGVEGNCSNSSVAVRKEAYSVVLKTFQDLVKIEDPNPSKRMALDRTPILSIIDSKELHDKLVMKKVFDGMFDRDEQVSKMMTDGVEECLSKDIHVRFAELFYIIIYQSSLSQSDHLELPNCGAKLLEMLFRHLLCQDAFKVIKLRDEGLPQSILNVSGSLTTKTYARTVLRSKVTFRQKVIQAPTRREIDVQMPIAEILHSFLQLSKINYQICQELCVQMMKCLQGAGRRFDFDSVISKLLSDILSRDSNCLTPLVLDACRIFISGISNIPGFVKSVEVLKQKTCNSEGYLYTNILYEDILLRSEGRKQFIFSFVKDEDNDATMRDEEFSLEGLIKAFGSLSNWDDLRSQDKRQVEDSLPPLWTRDEDFTVSLRNYFEGANKKLDDKLWFNKLVASYYAEETSQDKFNWLKQIERWPKRNFVTSAVIEAIQWQLNEIKIAGDIGPPDCLAEWAARLMIRSSYHNQSTDSGSEEKLSVCQDELIWCREANKRMLPQLALQCIERNRELLTDTEVLPWLQEKVIASRLLGLKNNNISMLQKALEAAEKQTSRFAEQSCLVTNVSMQKLILLLHQDLGSITKSKLDDIMQEVIINIIREKGKPLTSKNTEILKSVYESAMMCFDGLWEDSNEETQNEIILSIIEIIDKVLQYGLTKQHNLLFSVLFSRLAYSNTTMRVVTAKKFMELIHRVFHHLDIFSVAILKKVISVLPTSILNDDFMTKLQDKDLDICKEYFQLICDTNYSLLQYCELLRKNVLDDDEWTKTFITMKKKLFETTYGGSDFQSLNTLKKRLYVLENMTEIDPKAKELKSIIDELRCKPNKPSLRLSQLCPDMCTSAILYKRRVDLQRLLRLPSNVYVVKFFEQISVFTDSIRRPCVIKALLSNGVIRKYICKSGEPLFRDASVQRVAAILPVMNPTLQVRSYNVTPLSDDSAIIEYLEDHIRLRDLMEEKYDINVPVQRAGHEKLILAPSLAMEQYNDMCDKVTPYILRSSIEHNCSCVNEFIVKKRTFEHTLSSMTVLNWLFGVGDRHLQNIMFSLRDGGVCSVDWASIFQYGSQELPPARLTANLLAVCDVKVLESRLQYMLTSLKQSQRLLEAFIQTSFYWLSPELNELKHIKSILDGRTTSYTITRECLDGSRKKYKEHYVRLLDQVFENVPQKEVYSVEEQISCLLQHCTDLRIMAVAPQGWEAWL